MPPFGLGLSTIVRQVTFVPGDIPGLQIYLDARYGVTQSGGLISAVVDQSGNAHNLSISSGYTAPLYQAAGINGLPSFAATGVQAFNIAGIEPGFLTSVHGFLIAQGIGVTEPPALGQGAWMVGTGAGGFCDYADGNIYDNFGSTMRPGSSGGAGSHPSLINPFCLEVSYPPPTPTTTVRTVKINGTTVITENPCTPGWPSSALGQNQLLASSVGTYVGYQSAFIVYDHVLTSPQHAALAAWIFKTWGISI